MSAVIEGRSLVKTYSRGGEAVHALRGTDVTVASGEIVGISGASGSGKTTLLAVLCGWEVPDSGTVDCVRGPVDRLLWSDLAIVPQSMGLLDDLTVLENILLAGRLARPRRRDTDAAAQVMARLGIDQLGERLPTEISLGERQRTAIARALYLRPALVLADEPTAHQDRGYAQAALDAMRAHTDAGGAVIVVSHDTRTLDFCDRRLTMLDGVLHAD